MTPDLEGIDPDKIELKDYQPENKEERGSVGKVKNSSSYFDNIDNERKQYRLNFIKWVVRNWGVITNSVMAIINQITMVRAELDDMRDMMDNLKQKIMLDQKVASRKVV